MQRRVVIDCFPESAARYAERHAIVCVDVFRFATMATTALEQGWRVYPVRSTDQAFVLAGGLEDPLFAGELGGRMPYGFHVQNSPIKLGERDDKHRPLVLLSTSGSQLLHNARGAEGTYLACFRNFSAVAKCLMERHDHVAVLGAGTRGAFRREDQMACAWVAGQLVEAGYQPVSEMTCDVIEHWAGAEPALAAEGKSAAYLRRTEQQADIDFTVGHIDDVTCVPMHVGKELLRMEPRE